MSGTAEVGSGAPRSIEAARTNFPDSMEASVVADPLAATTLLDAGSERDRLRAAETKVLGTVQRELAHPPVVRGARGLSNFGEHAAGWLAFGLLGASLDRRQRRGWLYATAGVAAAHGASIGVKRVVRRPRPDDPTVAVLAGTPGRLSFPSSHASSTTAAAVLFGGLLGRRVAGQSWSGRLVGLLVPPMLLSRLVLGVHFPTDVLAGSALGLAASSVTNRVTGRAAKRAGRGR
jgi:membrane-associated phospholipid phosphatase